MQYVVKNRGRKFIVDANSHKDAVKKLRDKLIESGSEEAFKKNIATEIKAGKDPKQAVAIAYSVQRENDEEIKDGRFIFTVHYKNGETKNIDVQALNYQEAVKKLMTDPNVDSIDDIKDSAIKDATAEVEITCSEPNNTHKYVQKFKINNSTLEKYRRGNRSEAEQEIFREVNIHADILFGNTSFRILNVKDSEIRDSSFAVLHPTRYEFLSVGGKSWVKEDSTMIQKFNSEKEAIEFANKNTSLNCRIVKFEDSNTITDADIPHITKEQWNKIPKDYKHVDSVTGKKQAFAGSLGIAPGGTTLLTEGMHFIIDAEEKNYTYIMFGTTGEKRVDNLTKAEAEHLLKNNKLLGYDGKIVETKTLKDAKQEYRVNYHNSYTGRHAVDYVEANNVKEALRKFGRDVALRGDGTANINVHSISPNEGYQRIYGKLSELLKNKDFQDSVEDDITNQQYFTDDEIVTKNNGTLHIHELSNGKYNVHFESNWNSSYDWDKNNITWEEVIKIKNSIKDSKIKDAYYNIGGYESETDKMLRQDISKAKSMGLKTYVEKVDESYQLTVEGSYDKVKKIVENYFAGDVSSIGDKQVFSEETMNSVQRGIEKDYENMDKRLSELHDDRLSPMTYSKLKELGYDQDDWKDLTQEQANELVAKGRKETTNRETSNEENSTIETKSTNKNTEKYKVPEEYDASKWTETEEYTKFMKEQFKTGDPKVSEYGLEFKGNFSKEDLDKARNYFDGEGLDILETKNGIMLSQGADYVDDQEEYEEFAKQREEWLNQENKPKIENNPENRGRWLELIKKQFDEGELSEKEQKEFEELDAVINPPKTEEQKEKDKEKTKLNNELETLKSELKPNNKYYWKKSEIKEKEDRIAELERKIAELESK